MPMMRNRVELASSCSFFVFFKNKFVTMWRNTSPHWTKKMRPTQERLAQKVRVTGTRSKFDSPIKVEIC